MEMPQLNSSQRTILDLFKQKGALTIPWLAGALDLNVETVRGHVSGLEAATLVRREGRIADGPGRPEIVFGLTPAAEHMFPRREADILQGLATYLRRTGNRELLEDYFGEWIREQRDDAMPRLRGFSGRARAEAVAAILSELGFMATVEDPGEATGEATGPRLRLCHCPLRALVDATTMPCHAEVGLVQELLGTELHRETYIPAGDASCSYRLQPAAT